MNMSPAIAFSTEARPSALIAGRLLALRRRRVGVAVLTGASLVVVIGLEVLAMVMFLDWWLDLAWGVRLVSLLAQAGLVSWLLYRHVFSPWWRQPGEDELALMVEKARPEFRSRLIAAVQLARPGAVPPTASTSLASAVIAEAEAMARAADFRRIVDLGDLRRFGLLAVVIPALAAAGLYQGRDVCGELLKRVLLGHGPVPRKTRIVVPEGDRTIGIGDTLRLEAFTEGLMPSHGSVEVKYRSRRAQGFPVEQDRDNPAHFGRTLENVQESFAYRFELGDGVTRDFAVTAVPRPTVGDMACEQVFPAYTGLKPVARSLGDLTLLAGSVLKLKFTATKDLQSAAIQLVGLGRELPLALDPQVPRTLEGVIAIPARGLTGFQVHMVDTENMESRDSAVYRVDILPDKVPVVRLTYPDRKEELVTRHATMLLAFEATDDFRIRKVRLKYKASSVDNGAEKSTELDLEAAGDDGRRLRRRHEWKIAEALPGIGEGGVIEYWFEVEDNNEATGPGYGVSDHQLARVVSEAEKRADLLNRAGDYLGSISDVALDQEKLNRSLGGIIRAKTGLR